MKKGRRAAPGRAPAAPRREDGPSDPIRARDEAGSAVAFDAIEEPLSGRRGPIALGLAALAVATAVIAATALLAWPILTAGYLSDDWAMLFFARHAGLRDTLVSFFPPRADSPHAGFFRPLGLLLWQLAIPPFAGTPPPALPQHLLSLAFHAGSTVLVVALARARLSWAASLLAGALFALFPTHGECLGWISARFDLAATFFGLVAILLCSRDGARASALGAGALLLGLLTKESVLVVPALLVLYVWWLAPPDAVRRLATSLPLMAASTAVYLLVRFRALGGLGGHLRDGVPIALGAGWSNVLDLLRGCLGLIALPFRWRFLMGAGADLPRSGWLLAAALAAASTGLFARAPRSGSRPAAPRGLAFGALWALAALSVTLGADRWNEATFEATRYLYLPAVGVCLALGALTDRIARRWLVAIPAFLMLTLFASTVRASLIRWRAAADRAASIVWDVRRQVPAPVHGTKLALPPLPDNVGGAFVFRNGIEEAMRLTFDDWSLTVNPAVTLYPGRFAVFAWEGEHLVLTMQRQDGEGPSSPGPRPPLQPWR